MGVNLALLALSEAFVSKIVPLFNYFLLWSISKIKKSTFVKKSIKVP